MENTKLTQEQLQQISDIQSKYQAVAQEFGNIELQKLALEARTQATKQFLSELQDQEKQLAETIEQQYGKGNIDLSTGEFVPMVEPAIIEE
jgi:hypothetical protein